MVKSHGSSFTLRLLKFVFAAGLVASSAATPARAQFPEQPESRTVDVTAAFGVNVLLGGLTAATRALVERHDPVRAFAIGAVGGAVHFSAKLIGPGTSVAGIALGATGTAIIVNAGRGVSPWDELYVPVGPVRVRVTPHAPRKVRVALHAYDAVILARNLTRTGLLMDWRHTGSTGTFVLRTDNKQLWDDDRELNGVAVGSVIVMSAFSTDPPRTAHHELIHVHQYMFLDEAIGRPVEAYLRRRIPGARWLPRWLELGVVPPALAALEYGLFGPDGPVLRLVESEAEMVARCC